MTTIMPMYKAKQEFNTKVLERLFGEIKIMNIERKPTFDMLNSVIHNNRLVQKLSMNFDGIYNKYSMIFDILTEFKISQQDKISHRRKELNNWFNIFNELCDCDYDTCPNCNYTKNGSILDTGCPHIHQQVCLDMFKLKANINLTSFNGDKFVIKKDEFNKDMSLKTILIKKYPEINFNCFTLFRIPAISECIKDGFPRDIEGEKINFIDYYDYDILLSDITMRTLCLLNEIIPIKSKKSFYNKEWNVVFSNNIVSYDV